MINMFRALMEKVDSIQKHMSKINRERNTPRKCHKKMSLLRSAFLFLTFTCDSLIQKH